MQLIGLALSLALTGLLLGGRTGAASDPYLDAQWQERASGIAALRAAGADGRGVTVGLVDGGYDLTHPDLDGIELLYLPPVSGDPFAPTHGTGILGVLAAETGNRIGIAGIIPRAKIIARAAGEEDDERIIDYLEDLADRGARVIGLSLGYQASVSGSTLSRAYERLRDRGVLIVGAAGNFGDADIRIYPARIDAAISVGAHDRNGRRADFSNRTGVTISAPGVEIPTTANGGEYALRSGTSLATPIVVGVIAALLSLDPSLSTEGALALLLASAVDSPDGIRRIDAAAALRLLRSGRPIARITELPKLPRSSPGQLITIRTGSVGEIGDCSLTLSLGNARLERPCAPSETVELGALLAELGAEGPAGLIEIRLESAAGGSDRGEIAFDFEAPPYDPEPDDRSAPSLEWVSTAPLLAGPGGDGATEVRLSDARGLRPGEAFCREVSSRSSDLDGVPSGWGRQVDESADYPYRLEGETIILRLGGIESPLAGRLEWRIECADSSGNFTPPSIAAVGVPLEGAALGWDRGGRLLTWRGARGGDVTATDLDGARIEWTAHGRRLAIVGPTGAGLGAIEMIINGTHRCSIDLAVHADGSARARRDRTLLFGPGSRCGDLRLSNLSDAPTLQRVELRAVIDAPGEVVPLDAIAIW